MHKIFSGFLIGTAICYSAAYADQEEGIFQQADLVIEGTSAAVAQMSQLKEGTVFHAVEERDLDFNKMRFMVTFHVDRILKGAFPEDTLSIAVHSPSLSFHLPPWGGKKRYRLYFKGSYETVYHMVGKEPI